MNKLRIKLSCLQLFLFMAFLGLSVSMLPAAEQVVTITIPADILRRTVSDALPVPLEKNNYLDGDVFVESLDTLKIGKNVIFLKGVVAGNNLVMNTKIAGQSIRLKIGSVRLPMTCNLFLRFDSQRKTLFITPKFSDPGAAKNADPADALLPLLTALGGKEYPVNLDSMQPFLLKLGSKNVPFKLEPVAVNTSQGMLSLKLRPKVSKK